MRNVMMTLGLLLLAAACNARLGLGSVGRSSSTPTSSSSGDRPKLAVGGGDNEEKTLELSKKLTYEHVSKGMEASEVFQAAGLPTTFNPRGSMKNPDPKWILQWDALVQTDETKTAIVQAAVNRTWTAKVHADYAAYRKAWKAIDDEARPKLVAILDGKGYHARAKALAELMAEVRARAEAEKVLYDGSPDVAMVGILDDIVRAMVQVHGEEKVPFLLGRYGKAYQIDLAGFAQRGRPFAADDAVERDLFVRAAQKLGTHQTPPLPVLYEYGRGLKAVRWPVADERRAHIQAAVEALLAEGAPAKQLAGPARMSSLFNGDSPDPSDPKLRWVDPPLGGTDHYNPLVVDKVRDGGAEVDLVTTYEYSTPYDCKATNQVESVDANGGVRYVQNCKYKFHKREHRLTVRLPELPAGVELAKGDVVALYADLEDRREKGDKVTYRMTGRAVVSVQRDGKDLVKLW